MIAKILIPVKSTTSGNARTADNGGRAIVKPSFLLIPALEVADASAGAAK